MAYNLVKIEGESGIVKDTRTGAVIVDNLAAFKKFKQSRTRESNLINLVSSLESRLIIMEAKLEAALQEIDRCILKDSNE